MSLFEWLGESIDPGSVGEVRFGRGGRPGRANWVIIVRFVIAAVIVRAYFRATLEMIDVSWAEGGVLLGFAAVYLPLAYFIRPEPDLSNLGWFGGLIDNPFRYSDDIN
jgi:hypothetical protein